MVRSEVRSFAEASPGVSMRVRSVSFRDGQPTSIRSMDSMGRPSRSIESSPSSRRNGSSAEPDGRSSAVTRYPRSWRYHVTMRVHSPASVAARRSPTRALRSVDLPALTRPAMATRSGSSSRRTVASTVAAWSVPSATRRASSAMRRTSTARSPEPSAIPRRHLVGEGPAVAGLLDDRVVVVGHEDAHLLGALRPVLDLVLEERRGPVVQDPVRGLAGRPAFVGGIVSQKKWMWRVPGMSGVKWNASNATA